MITIKQPFRHFMKQQFIHFLKDNNAYETFMFNFNKDKETRTKFYSTLRNYSPKEFFEIVDFHDYILVAFEWKNTSKGRYFWADLSIKWNNIFHY